MSNISKVNLESLDLYNDIINNSALPVTNVTTRQYDEISAELCLLHEILREKHNALNVMRAKLLPLTQARAAEIHAMRNERLFLESDEVS